MVSFCLHETGEIGQWHAPHCYSEFYAPTVKLITSHAPPTPYAPLYPPPPPRHKAMQPLI